MPPGTESPGPRLLFATKRPCYPEAFSGGAERSMHALLEALGSRGVACRAMGMIPPSSPAPPRGGRLYYDAGYPVVLAPAAEFGEELRRVILDFKPTAVVTQLDGAGEILAATHRRRISGILYFRDTLEEWIDAESVRRTAARGTLLVANSLYIQSHVRKAYGSSALVVYPAVDWREYRTAREDADCVTMVNPAPPKGVSTLVRVARRLPHRRFLLVDGWRMNPPIQQLVDVALETLPNVTRLPRTPDIRDVFRRTALLLVPSIWEEAFGRVVLEAQASGIPVIASQRGGLPECVGGGGLLIEDYLNPEAWVQAIESVLGNRQRAAALSEAASRNVTREEFSPGRNIEAFLDVVRKAHRLTRGARGKN